MLTTVSSSDLRCAERLLQRYIALRYEAPEIAAKIDAALDKLPEHLRKAVLLVDVEGKSAAAAAKELYCAACTARRWRLKALKMMKDQLASL
jgi:DNA-directed RNA polymerase specialized sigma24 family protein